VLAEARALDGTPRRSRLHGVPVGLKDIIDTADMPTENGTVLHAGRRPRADATVVSRLRAAGAVVIGKTVTTELAVYGPNQTRNPHNPEHTPGGSSSGSAAAVAAQMVPLALGTQTNGSVIRPAAYCGVYGFKPSHGLISRAGILRQSPPLDTVGVMARSVPDLALLAEVLMGYDPQDPALRPSAPPHLLEVALQRPPVVPDLGFVRTPVWDQAEDETKAAFDELLAALGERASEAALPDVFDGAIALHATLMEADLARSFAAEYERGRDRLTARLREMIERGQRCLALDYNRALEAIGWLQRAVEPLFQKYDALLTPATTGPAPHGLGATGSPVFCTIWTLCGMPAVTLPLLQAGNGLPLGVQLVGQKGDDARLLRTARWLATHLRDQAA
jgi:Asp-tRNA(Asn)/Glu-tRNA(Gln) amidotransferase A subunit family amidase